MTCWGATFLGRRFPCCVGRGGITAVKREGDGATPEGIHRIVGLLYRPDRIAGSLPRWAEPIHRGDLWSDDPRDAEYNHWVRAPHGYGHERLYRADPLYDLILVTDWNFCKSAPGKGSAIFLHRWRKPRHPTAGCVAFDPADLRWIAARAVPGTRLIVRR